MTTARRFVFTGEFWVLLALAITGALLLWWLRAWAAMALPVVGGWVVHSRSRLKAVTQDLPNIFAGLSGKGTEMIEQWIETQLTALANKALAGLTLTAAEQAIVAASVSANVKLVMLLIEKEGLRIAAGKYPSIAAALQTLSPVA